MSIILFLHTAHCLLIELVTAVDEERKLLLWGSEPIKLLEAKDWQEVTCVQNSIFFLYQVSSRKVALDLMHVSMRVRAACVLSKTVWNRSPWPVSGLVVSPYCSRLSTSFKHPYDLTVKLSNEFWFIRTPAGNISLWIWSRIYKLWREEKILALDSTWNGLLEFGNLYRLHLESRTMTCLSKTLREIYTRAAEVWGRLKILVSGAGYAGCSVESSWRHRWNRAWWIPPLLRHWARVTTELAQLPLLPAQSICIVHSRRCCSISRQIVDS